MARPKSDGKRDAILEATIETVAADGIGASTALVAQRAGVAQGTVFKYFETKNELFNAAYLSLKDEVGRIVLPEQRAPSDAMIELRHFWVSWLRWGTSNPSRRLAVLRLGASDVITAETRQRSKTMSAGCIDIVERARMGGVFQNQPLEFVISFFEALGGATMDAMIAAPERANDYCETAFEALRRALSWPATSGQRRDDV